MPRSALVSIVASVLVPRAAAEEAISSSVFNLLAQLQQQARRQATQGSALAFLQHAEPVYNGQSTEKTFHGLDTNADGVLSRDEIATFATSQGLDAASAKSELAMLDTDGDGALSMSEFVGVLSSTDAADGLNSAGATSTAGVVAPAALPPQVALPAQVALQQASQAPAALAPRAPMGGPAKQAVVSPVAPPSLADQSTSASIAASGVIPSSEFVSTRAKQLLASWNKFESDAKRAETEAAALRAKAREELREAQELSAIADNVLLRAKQASLHTAGEQTAAAGSTAAQM
mmetsp:Transcript_126172/g.327570  ORF Transcript_126172/g.327570 Transcript_126172/m.327570 type:complete len:290 (-) Transcript_126172:68-937(-)